MGPPELNRCLGPVLASKGLTLDRPHWATALSLTGRVRLPPHRLPHGKGRAELPTHSSFTADLWPSTEVPKVWEHQTTVTLLVASE